MSGWKDWQYLERVTEADFQSYIQDQVVQVYANSTARSSALGTAVSEGMVSYLSDSNTVQFYNGSAWESVGGASVDWADVLNKPATFPPSTHTHVISDVTSLQDALDAKAPIANPTFTGVVSGNASAASAAGNGASALGFKGIPTSGSGGSGAYTLVASDAGELVYTTSSRTVTIPSNASVPFEIGTSIVFISGAGATTTIAITSDTLRLAGAGTTGSRTLAAHGMATAVKVAATTWYISGNGLT